jgi:hypothetical protein
MPRELVNIEVNEISLVDIPAIKRKFLIVKKGKDMQKSTDKDQDNSDIENLIKKGELKMKELIEFYKNLTGDNVDFNEPQLEFLKKLTDESVKDIKDAISTLNKYKGDFSKDLQDAVSMLAKWATKPYPYPYPAKKSDEDIAKAGAKFSKDTIDALKKVIEDLITILPENERWNLKKSEETAGKDTDVKIKDAIEKVEKQTAETTSKLEAKLGEKDKSISELTKRLDTLEKVKGIKKQIEGQDLGDGDGDEDLRKSKKLWPSFDFELVEE